MIMESSIKNGVTGGVPSIMIVSFTIFKKHLSEIKSLPSPLQSYNFYFTMQHI